MEDSLLSKSEAELRSHIASVLDSAYELDKEIGRGGMGIVFKARDRRLKRPVAVKLLPPELAFRSEIRSRFLREAETAAQLSHPNIVPIYSVDEKGGLVFFIMGFVDGDNLARRIHDRGPMPPEEVRRILREVADALAYAHANKVVHRDIKPDNILLDAQSQRPMVTDFGIARAISEGGEARLTATGIAIGTPAFMSPEQSAGDRDVDGRSDLYSLGVVAYQMLCGDLPFNANSTPALLVKHLSERPVPIDQRASVPPDLARAVMLLLEKDPANRFQSAAELKSALETGQVPALPAAAGSAYPQAPSPYATADAMRSGTGTAALTPQPLTSMPDGERLPTPDELARWNAPMVVDFRRKIAPFIWVNGAFVVVNLIGGPNMLFVTAFWSIGIAYQYAKLWSEGYDWHDVFRQPRERMVGDVFSEWGEDVRSLFDSKTRERVRTRQRLRAARPDLLRSPAAPAAVTARDAAALGSGPHAAAARDALVDRDEILRLVEGMSRSERSRIPDVASSATTLANTVLALAAQLADLERTAQGLSAAAIDREINTLEAAANPLDFSASEERVRRLALLKRQRRTVADVDRRRETLSARLDSCSLALKNMRFDVLRLKTGAQTYQHVTTVAEQAMQLAREVDSAVYVADQMARISPRTGATRRP
ncbi:MAG: protein kinase [Gemmatimonadaceae bacterium]|nr:protein kinase [Gemmatimonadaceae bacterium]